MIRDLEDLKHHEAGHYAMAALLGMPVVEVAAVSGSTTGRGHVLFWFHPSSREDAIRKVVIILAGLLEVADWREFRWGRLDPQRSTDEAQLLELIEAWSIQQETYDRLITDTLRLMASDEFDRLQSLIVAMLDHWPVVHERLLEVVAT